MSRMNRLASIAVLAGAAMALPVVASAQKIVINELYRAGNLEGTDEWLELLVVEDITAAELNAYFYGDSANPPAAKFAAYQFTNMEAIATLFPAGTLIVVGGNTADYTENTDFDPADNKWDIRLKFASAHITEVSDPLSRTGDLAATDVAWVDTVATGDTLTPAGFGVKYGPASGVFGDNATVTVAAPNNNANLFLAGDDAFDPLDWSVNGTTTPGEPNGGGNSDYIDELRRGDVLLIELQSFTATAPHAGAPVQIAWATASEIDTVGFHVHRASSQGGALVPGAPVSNALIPAQGSATAGASYSLVDPLPVGATAAGRSYFLVEVDTNGTRTSYGPFQAVVGGTPSGVGEWPLY